MWAAAPARRSSPFCRNRKELLCRNCNIRCAPGATATLKKGNEYQVLGVARHSETEEEMVVYRALYGEGGLWVRPAAMWLENVTRDGVTQPRFTYIGE